MESKALPGFKYHISRCALWKPCIDTLSSVELYSEKRKQTTRMYVCMYVHMKAYSIYVPMYVCKYFIIGSYLQLFIYIYKLVRIYVDLFAQFVSDFRFHDFSMNRYE